ncbi:hypothetical protein Ddye_004353 [Dipteronia dyeriana]|uniref:Uncharacterized protein n=1 Tax=Dipteronia dyeriana TaxID=168575 RepID=A0AAD9XTZ9_9ROSI|nr:hypothetical protein Ddye_004353 [Dipteronia dyeriana]
MQIDICQFDNNTCQSQLVPWRKDTFDVRTNPYIKSSFLLIGRGRQPPVNCGGSALVVLRFVAFVRQSSATILRSLQIAADPRFDIHLLLNHQHQLKENKRKNKNPSHSNTKTLAITPPLSGKNSHNSTFSSSSTLSQGVGLDVVAVWFWWRCGFGCGRGVGLEVVERIGGGVDLIVDSADWRWWCGFGGIGGDGELVWVWWSTFEAYTCLTAAEEVKNEIKKRTDSTEEEKRKN